MNNISQNDYRNKYYFLVSIETKLFLGISNMDTYFCGANFEDLISKLQN